MDYEAELEKTKQQLEAAMESLNDLQLFAQGKTEAQKAALLKAERLLGKYYGWTGYINGA